MPKPKVLLIDDEKDFAELIGLRIKSWGYDFISAGSAAEGLLALDKKAPDLVILDYLMPGMDGLEALKAIRKINKLIPVIMFTAHPDGRSMSQAGGLKVSAYVPKLSVYSNAEDNLKSAIELALKQAKRKKNLSAEA